MIALLSVSAGLWGDAWTLQANSDTVQQHGSAPAVYSAQNHWGALKMECSWDWTAGDVRHSCKLIKGDGGGSSHGKTQTSHSWSTVLMVRNETLPPSFPPSRRKVMPRTFQIWIAIKTEHSDQEALELVNMYVTKYECSWLLFKICVTSYTPLNYFLADFLVLSVSFTSVTRIVTHAHTIGHCFNFYCYLIL